jgi:opacity protein-like surface antigen
MRRLVVALGVIALASDALAADYEMPTLRGSSPFVPGSPTFTPWTGFYAGGQAGYAISKMKFSRVTPYDPIDPFLEPLVPPSFWAVFGQQDTAGAASYGAFVGYNTQWDDVVLGVEANYNHTSLFGSSSVTRGFLNQTLPAGGTDSYDGTMVATASMKITDYGTLRGRAGWVYDNVLAYAMVGLAVGWGQTSRAVTVFGTPAPASPGGTPFVISEGANSSHVLWGYSAGVGLDVLLTPTVFLRGEYEFVQFFTVSTVKANVQAVRGGVGFKF